MKLDRLLRLSLDTKCWGEWVAVNGQWRTGIRLDYPVAFITFKNALKRTKLLRRVHIPCQVRHLRVWTSRLPGRVIVADTYPLFENLHIHQKPVSLVVKYVGVQYKKNQFLDFKDIIEYTVQCTYILSSSFFFSPLCIACVWSSWAWCKTMVLNI